MPFATCCGIAGNWSAGSGITGKKWASEAGKVPINANRVIVEVDFGVGSSTYVSDSRHDKSGLGEEKLRQCDKSAAKVEENIRSLLLCIGARH